MLYLTLGEGKPPLVCSWWPSEVLSGHVWSFLGLAKANRTDASGASLWKLLHLDNLGLSHVWLNMNVCFSWLKTGSTFCLVSLRTCAQSKQDHLREKKTFWTRLQHPTSAAVQNTKATRASFMSVKRLKHWSLAEVQSLSWLNSTAFKREQSEVLGSRWEGGLQAHRLYLQDIKCLLRAGCCQLWLR